jgi:hypothetical protein
MWEIFTDKHNRSCKTKQKKSRFYEQIAKYLTADNSVFPYSNAKDMRVTQDVNPFGEIIAHAQCNLLIKSAFERIFNVMQLILVKIK